MMTLAQSMQELASSIERVPSDIDVEANITTKVHDDVPPMFVEYITPVDSDNTSYQHVIETRDGIISKSIILWIRD